MTRTADDDLVERLRAGEEHAVEELVSRYAGLVYRVADARWDSWIGLGIPCGLTSDSPHLGIAIRTGARF